MNEANKTQFFARYFFACKTHFFLSSASGKWYIGPIISTLSKVDKLRADKSRASQTYAFISTPYSRNFCLREQYCFRSDDKGHVVPLSGKPYAVFARPIYDVKNGFALQILFQIMLCYLRLKVETFQPFPFRLRIFIIVFFYDLNIFVFLFFPQTFSFLIFQSVRYFFQNTISCSFQHI